MVRTPSVGDPTRPPVTRRVVVGPQILPPALRDPGRVATAAVAPVTPSAPKAPSFNPLKVIEKVRDGKVVSLKELKAFQEGLEPRQIGEEVKPLVSDAQLGAFKIAADIKGVKLKKESDRVEADRITDAILQRASDKLQDSNAAIRDIVRKTIAKNTPGSPELTREEIFTFIRGVVDGTATDLDCGMWLMSVYLHNLSDMETAYLSEAMWKTGGEINVSDVGGPTADKHAAGGSSDNTSFLIAALLACFGAKVPMMSGRLLAHTGGTLDKLEAILGFKVNLTEAEVQNQLKDGPGCAIFGQMPTIAPADGRLYELRQITGTVQNVPLIAASIISKKLAEGAKNLVLVGTFGSGAFARNPQEAQKLSDLMMKTAKTYGRNVVSYLVDMSQPLTPYVGPAQEMAMSIRALKDQPDPRLKRFKDVSIDITAQLLVMAGVYAPDKIEDAKAACREKLHSGEALEKFRQMVVAQGGNPDVVGEMGSYEDSTLFKKGRVRFEIRATKTGFVQAIRADEIGNAVNDLGAGRSQKGAPIDHGVGVADLALVGDEVKEGDIIGVVYANRVQSANKAAARIMRAYSIGTERVEAPKVVYGIVS